MAKVITINERNIKTVMTAPADTWYRAYKLSAYDGQSPYYPAAKPRFTCEMGAVFVHDNPDTNPAHSCGTGVNVGTLKWCLESISAAEKPRFLYPPATKNVYNVKARHETLPARLWCVEFRGWDIAVLPRHSLWWDANKVKYDSKFRLKHCRVLYEVDLLQTKKKKTKKKRRS